MNEHKTTPPLSDKDHEAKLISLTLQMAEQQLIDGTASSQVMTHFLRLGSIRSKVELEKLRLENNLLTEKIQSEKMGQQLKEMFQDVMESLRDYQAPPPEI